MKQFFHRPSFDKKSHKFLFKQEGLDSIKNSAEENNLPPTKERRKLAASIESAENPADDTREQLNKLLASVEGSNAIETSLSEDGISSLSPEQVEAMHQAKIASTTAQFPDSQTAEDVMASALDFLGSTDRARLEAMS